MDERIRVLELHASDYENGLQVGKEFQEPIREAIRKRFCSLSRLRTTRGMTELSEQAFCTMVKSYLPPSEEYAPELMDEVRGLAVGAQVTFEEMFGLNCFLDMADLAYPAVSQGFLPGGCTTFGFKTPDGQAYLAQNYDVGSFFERGTALLSMKPAGKPASLVFTIAGIVGCAGMNEAGIALVINNLTPRDSRFGVVHAFIVRKVLAQEKLGDALDVILGAKRASGTNYVLADAHGQLIGIEASATAYAVNLGQRGYMGHSNCYTDRHLQRDFEGSMGYSGDSIIRLSRSEALLEQMHGKQLADEAEVLENLRLCLKDHVNHPYSICRHRNPNIDDLMSTKSIASLIMIPRTKTMLLARGNPCENRFMEYALT